MIKENVHDMSKHIEEDILRFRAELRHFASDCTECIQS